MLIYKEKTHIGLGLDTALKSLSSPICPTLLLRVGSPITLRMPSRPPAMVAKPVGDKPTPVEIK